jgi:ABC-type uncharacterized transport system YnjBCD permease subunit
MPAAAQDLIKAFDSLPALEQHEVAVAILRRAAPADDISEAALGELASTLFVSYDAEESGDADGSWFASWAI